MVVNESMVNRIIKRYVALLYCTVYVAELHKKDFTYRYDKVLDETFFTKNYKIYI